VNRRLGFVAGVICVITLLAGCTPKPAPTPTALFSSEAAAFKAAEQTYRAYVDALNKVDLSEPATFEDVYKWETGERLAGDKKALTDYHARHASMTGTTKIILLRPHRTNSAFSKATLAACVDVSALQIRNANGNSLISPDRPDVQSITIEVSAISDSESRFLVASVSGRSGDPEC